MLRFWSPKTLALLASSLCINTHIGKNCHFFSPYFYLWNKEESRKISPSSMITHHSPPKSVRRPSLQDDPFLRSKIMSLPFSFFPQPPFQKVPKLCFRLSHGVWLEKRVRACCWLPRWGFKKNLLLKHTLHNQRGRKAGSTATRCLKKLG